MTERREVEVEMAGGVLTATMSDDENRNALSPGLVQGLREAVARGNADASIRVIVITNIGSTFCAGANLKQRSQAKEVNKPDEEGSTSGGLTELFSEIQASQTPVVAKIAGHVMGGGNGLAAVCDISVASEEAKFGFTEVRLGVIPAMISVVCLPKMRHGDAMELFLRGNRIPAARAAELGLINRAVPAEALDSEISEIVSDLCKGSPNALGLAKTLLFEVPKRTQAEAFDWTTALSNELFAGDEAKAGMKAFIERRPAPWVQGPGVSEQD